MDDNSDVDERRRSECTRAEVFLDLGIVLSRLRVLFPRAVDVMSVQA